MVVPPGDLENEFAEVNHEVDYASDIVPPRVNATSFKIDEVYNLHKHNNISDDAIRLRIFKYFLVEEVREWLHKLPLNSNYIRKELVNFFLKKWFPPSKKEERRDKIFYFRQLIIRNLEK
ncbi:hypothetical protein HAX54_039640, partial [Datura stramonium]|nr:hypothetical protein [Datura stramonium]